MTEGSLEERVAKLKRKVLKDLVFVQGDSFMMGDIGTMWSPEKLYYTPDLDNKPPHKVTLTSYNIARFKTPTQSTTSTRMRQGDRVREWSCGPTGYCHRGSTASR
ncbi:hypothetical protein AWV80_03920 [Cupriavidus sp. UYMU48A]|nr:hypothetical protein AWV80_03920 [Cupriavidus sp. UYMU48A]